MSSLLPLQFMALTGVGISSPFDSDHAECFAYVSANNVTPIRTYVSANIHFHVYMSVAAPAAQQQTAQAPRQAQTDYLRWNYYTRTILPPPVVSDVTH